jgi:hypothetical protein
MFASLRAALPRLSRWPRRIAALCCLSLAAVSALTPARGREPAQATTTADLLRRGEVAVSVGVTSAPSDLQRGDRIGLLAAPAEGGLEPAGSLHEAQLLADRLRVLAVARSGTSGTDPPTVLVAARRDQALRIAATTGRSVLVVVDHRP